MGNGAMGYIAPFPMFLSSAEHCRGMTVWSYHDGPLLSGPTRCTTLFYVHEYLVLAGKWTTALDYPRSVCTLLLVPTFAMLYRKILLCCLSRTISQVDLHLFTSLSLSLYFGIYSLNSSIWLSICPLFNSFVVHVFLGVEFSICW